MKKKLLACLPLLISAPLLFSCSSDNEDTIEKKEEIDKKEETVINVENTKWVSDKVINDWGRALPAYYIEFQGPGKCMVYEYQTPGDGAPGYLVGNSFEYALNNNKISIIEEYWDYLSDPGKWAKREYGTCSKTSATELTFERNGQTYKMTKTNKDISSF